MVRGPPDGLALATLPVAARQAAFGRGVLQARVSVFNFAYSCCEVAFSDSGPWFCNLHVADGSGRR